MEKVVVIGTEGFAHYYRTPELRSIAPGRACTELAQDLRIYTAEDLQDLQVLGIRDPRSTQLQADDRNLDDHTTAALVKAVCKSYTAHASRVIAATLQQLRANNSTVLLIQGRNGIPSIGDSTGTR
jgi:hypothetical protein